MSMLRHLLLLWLRLTVRCVAPAVPSTVVSGWFSTLDALSNLTSPHYDLLDLDAAQITAASQLVEPQTLWMHSSGALEGSAAERIQARGCAHVPPFTHKLLKRRLINQLRGKSCAVVGSGAAPDHGTLIDAHDVVVRMKQAPTHGHERAVGSRTDLRVGNGFKMAALAMHERSSQVLYYPPNSEWPWEKDTRWCDLTTTEGPLGKMLRGRSFRDGLGGCVTISGDFLRYATSLVAALEVEPLSPSSIPHSIPSSGLVAVLIMIHACTSVSLFNFGLCQNGENKQAGLTKWKASSGNQDEWLCMYYNKSDPYQPTGSYPLPDSTDHK